PIMTNDRGSEGTREVETGGIGSPKPSRRRSPAELDELRRRRREAHATETYGRFLRSVKEQGIPDDQAELAATSVLCALEQRLLPDIRKDMESQLPVRLRDLLHRCERHLKAIAPRSSTVRS